MDDSGAGGRPGRKCHCAGNCEPRSTTLTRRQFLELVGIGSAAAFLPSHAWADFELPPDELARWRSTLLAPAAPRRYWSGQHTDARLHLGGIGTGNFEIGSDGQLTTWQLFNTLRDGEVPLHFVVRSGGDTRLLQTHGGPDWPRVERIEMTGEYPFARLRFLDPGLPIELELAAFSPFAPLDTALSSIPAAAFVFRIRNPGPRTQHVSLAGLMQNPVGYEARGENGLPTNPCFGGNFNEPVRQGPFHGLTFRAVPAAKPQLDRPVAIYTLANLRELNSPPADKPDNLTVRVMADQQLPEPDLGEPGRTIFWLEEPPASTAPALLGAMREAVRRGATLVFGGGSQPLLQAYASWTGGKPVQQRSERPDIVFDDFEHGYENWQVQGNAFGQRPASGTLPNQQTVSGFQGHGLVNTYLNGDGTTGRLISRPFAIQRRFIQFLVGGGHYEQTQVRLVVGGKTVRATAGRDNERLEPAQWDVSELQGQTAHLEIVDEQQGGWGHINVDQIEFTDLPGSRELMVLLEDLLPARFSAVGPSTGSAEGRRSVEFENLELASGARALNSAEGLRVWSRPVGQGRVLLCAGAILEPEQAWISQARQGAYAFLCGLIGASYRVPTGAHPKAPGFGTLALAAASRQVSVLTAADDLSIAWKLFAADGHFQSAGQGRASEPSPAGRTLYGGVAASIEVPAGGSVEVPFLLAWHYPNKYNAHHEWMGCHYAVQWADAEAVIGAAAGNFPAWRQKTEQFHQALYNSSLPYWLLDCLTANAAILRHIGVVFRIANGDVYGWEGSNGCCDPTCTHVWGYEQSLSRLFPDLEKEMRRIDFEHQQRADGGINNRTEVPSPAHPTGEQPFADGHASCILKAYREALNHPDEGLFRKYWPGVKRAVDYLLERDAKAAGGQPTGVLSDDQWNTYDEALHGVTSFISGYYLAALRAGEEWARRVGETSVAEHFRDIFEKGRSRLVELCWNGDYFQQHLPDYAQRRGEVGPGCMSDQLIGQWWAHQLGLGYVLPREHVVSALRSVYRHNFKTDLTGWKHAPRAFAGARDKGLIICTWPKGGRPGGVMLYSDEVWTGIEYQVAAHLIYEGLIEEGLAIVKAARERYDGLPRPPIPRNPWNEIECGGHYARAMSSWSLLLALAGWHYDGPRGELVFTPRLQTERFESVFTGPQGWGKVAQSRSARTQLNQLSVLEGQLLLSKLTVHLPGTPRQVQVHLGARAQKHTSSFKEGLLELKLANATVVRAGDLVRVSASWV